MLLTHTIALASVFTAVSLAAELVPVSPYIGKHKTSCTLFKEITGSLVDNKIYTFGGCYAIPYIVNPDEEDELSFRNNDNRQNVTESSHVYDIVTNQWSFETNTPKPIQGASTTVIGQDIYLYNIQSKPRTSGLDLWKYSTNTKTWSKLPQLPFLIHGNLLTCHNRGRMYFMGSRDGAQRNIIHVHNMVTGSWEDSIFLDKRIRAKSIICHDTHISMIGKEFKEDKSSFFEFDFNKRQSCTKSLINSYYNGTVHVVEDFNISIGSRCEAAQIAQSNESFYVFSIGASKNETDIIKINTLTRKVTQYESLPHVLSNVLILPTESDEVYLFGGAKNKYLFSSFTEKAKEKKVEAVSKIKTYNHKLILSAKSDNDKVVEKDDEQDHRFNLQVPNN